MRGRRDDWTVNGRMQPDFLCALLYLQEASASFAKWEELMKGQGSGAFAADNPFTEVMSLVTQMYKQTAIAKVMRHQVVFYCTCRKSLSKLRTKSTKLFLPKQLILLLPLV